MPSEGAEPGGENSLAEEISGTGRRLTCLATAIRLPVSYTVYTRICRLGTANVNFCLGDPWCAWFGVATRCLQWGGSRDLSGYVPINTRVKLPGGLFACSNLGESSLTSVLASDALLDKPQFC